MSRLLNFIKFSCPDGRWSRKCDLCGGCCHLLCSSTVLRVASGDCTPDIISLMSQNNVKVRTHMGLGSPVLEGWSIIHIEIAQLWILLCVLTFYILFEQRIVIHPECLHAFALLSIQRNSCDGDLPKLPGLLSFGKNFHCIFFRIVIITFSQNRWIANTIQLY